LEADENHSSFNRIQKAIQKFIESLIELFKALESLIELPKALKSFSLSSKGLENFYSSCITSKMS
jgi:hypothetical protein